MVLCAVVRAVRALPARLFPPQQGYLQGLLIRSPPIQTRLAERRGVQGANHRIDGSFVATILETGAVASLYFAWKSITEGPCPSPLPLPLVLTRRLQNRGTTTTGTTTATNTARPSSSPSFPLKCLGPRYHDEIPLMTTRCSLVLLLPPLVLSTGRDSHIPSPSIVLVFASILFCFVLDAMFRSVCRGSPQAHPTVCSKIKSTTFVPEPMREQFKSRLDLSRSTAQVNNSKIYSL